MRLLNQIPLATIELSYSFVVRVFRAIELLANCQHALQKGVQFLVYLGRAFCKFRRARILFFKTPELANDVQTRQ
jgi:hypothetical protein